MFSKFINWNQKNVWWNNVVPIWNTALVQETSVVQNKITGIIEAHWLDQVNVDENKAIYLAILNITSQEWTNLELQTLSEGITTNEELSKIRKVHVFELTNEQDLPYLKVNWRHSDIVSLLYLYNFFDLTNWVSIEILLNEIELWNFDTIILFLNSKIELLINLIKNDTEKAFLYAKEFPEIIKIINSLLIKPWKNKNNLPWIQDFIKYLEETLWSIIKIFSNRFWIFQLDKDIDLALKYEDLNLSLQFEALKLSRNYAKQISYNGTASLNEINAIHDKVIGLIEETNLKIFEIISDADEIKLQKSIWKILNLIAIIRRYEQILKMWIDISEADTEIILEAFEEIEDLYSDKIDLDYIIISNKTFIKSILELLKKLKNANIDSLTQIPNRKTHDEKLIEIISKLYPDPNDRRTKNNTMQWEQLDNIECEQPYYLLLDIDHFKKFNDTFWHTLWDKVLYYIAQLIKNQIRKNDCEFRYWWEEFAIITEKTNLEWATKLAEKINKFIENNPYIDDDGIKYPITVSIWLSVFSERLCLENRNWTSVINSADKALYRAKNKWRNTFVVSNDVVWVKNINNWTPNEYMYYI